MINILNKFISYTESKRISVSGIIISVLVIASIRNIFELIYKFGYLYPKPNLINMYRTVDNFFFHFNTFWIAVFLVLAIILYLLTYKKNTIINSLKFAMFGMFIIIFPVLFDLIIGNKDMMLYPNDPRELFQKFGNYFNVNYKIHGLSPGMRYEVFLVSIFSGFYVFIKNRNLILSILAPVITFFTITFFGLWISFLGQIYEYGFDFSSDFLITTSKLLGTGTINNYWVMDISLVYSLMVLLCLALILYLSKKEQFFTIIKNFRVSRLFHYLILFVAGLTIAKLFGSQKADSSFVFSFSELFNYSNPFDFIIIIGGMISIFLSFQSAVIFNDYYDMSIDKISNNDRPLVRNIINPNQYKKIGIWFFITALYISYIINTAFFFFVLMTNLLAYVYSNEPFRLKKIFLLNNLILGFIALFVFHAGATLILDDRSFSVLPPVLSYAIVIGFTFATCIKDIKDYKGDKENGIQTFVTVFGLKYGKITVSLLIGATIILFPYALGIDISIFWLIPFILLFGILFFSRFENEKYIFIVYYLYILIIFYKYFETVFN